jgi:beta-lactamase superfamily II metal-dependent hydrolase
MRNADVNSQQSSKGSAKLKIDFYESGNGETIILEFPDGGLGIVDAHPSAQNSRPPVLALVANRQIHFVCLTHPHADHGIDLIPILKNHSSIREFWHTNSDVSPFVYHCLTERPNYPAPVRRFVNQVADRWADFLLDLYSSLDAIPDRTLHSRVQPERIAGVQIWFLGPDEQMAKKFLKAYNMRASGSARALPSPNLLSAILGIEYGGTLVILGGDALKQNWTDAIRAHGQNRLPHAVVLKVPHHGAANALALEKNRKNYLDLCAKARTVSILFAGDSKHPHPRVFQELRDRSELICLSNGLKGAHGAANPLGIRIPGARQVRASYMCQPQITIEIAPTGTMAVTRGGPCSVC